ncbi:MAG: hypothetical protein IJ588_06260 [Prevotella sp.]|nr:hypothetical protein [Prevotella sp.]
MTELKKSPVRFDEEKHEYWLGDRQLLGITSTLIHRAFPDKYKGVDSEVLQNAARKGKELHNLIEYHDKFGTDAIEHTDPRVQSYERLKTERGLRTIANEYLVSDEERYASSIDIVMLNQQDEICLVDIKTTWKLDRESTALQLSIYKRFFERQNPSLRVVSLFVLWLPNKDMSLAEMISLQPVSNDIIDALMEADIADTPFDITASYGNLPALVASAEDEIIRIEESLKQMKARQEQLKKGLYEVMEKYNVKSFVGSRVRLTRILPTQASSFDSKQFEADHPELYKQYTKTSDKKGSLKITINQ